MNRDDEFLMIECGYHLVEHTPGLIQAVTDPTEVIWRQWNNNLDILERAQKEIGNGPILPGDKAVLDDVLTLYYQAQWAISLRN